MMRLKSMVAALVMVLCGVVASAQTDSTFFVKGSMGRLAAHLQLPALSQGKKCHVVVICHGFTGNMEEPLHRALAARLLEEGFGVMRFDFNAHGRSEGKFEEMTVLNEIDDAMAVIACVRKLPQTDGISLLGHSQGGVVAAMTAGRLGSRVVQRLVMMAPAAVLRDDALRGNTMGAMYDPWHAPEYVQLPSGVRLGRAYIQTAISLPVYETAARYDGPALVIHGMDDRVVPYTYGERFQREMTFCTLNLIPGENHGFGANLSYAVSLAVDWLKEAPMSR